MRYLAPARGRVDMQVFGRLPLAAWQEYAGLLQGESWPSISWLNALWPSETVTRFVAQNAALLADGLHYEQRIAGRGTIATREGNWHDLLNAMVWLRYPGLKHTLNQRQVGEIAAMGPKQRSRAQYALTHFDEGGLIVAVRDPQLLTLWDRHDWHGLFWRHRQAWRDGSIRIELFGHALLEQALTPAQLLVGKALAFQCEGEIDMLKVQEACRGGIASGRLLRDPLELRPLPLPGIPGWHPANDDETFHLETACYQPRRAGREYPVAPRLST
ncbi:MAG: DUF3025 domain-containing protein [Rhodanobacter sp.]